MGLLDGPPLYELCGRECNDGSPCENFVSTPGDACHHHDEDDPRVDDGPESPEDVDANIGRRKTLWTVGVKGIFVLAKASLAAVGAWLGLGYHESKLFAGLGIVAFIFGVAFAINWTARALGKIREWRS